MTLLDYKQAGDLILLGVNSMHFKDEAIKNIIKIEGGYVDDPSDSGGETKYGITKKSCYGFRY